MTKAKRPSAQGAAERVGVRELKATLSKRLQQVRGGASLTITDRGETVARIIPAGIPSRLEKLMREGVVSWSGHKPVIEEPAIRLRGRGPSASNIVIEMREDREQALLSSIAPKRRRRRS